jgi:GT2 family glycosyltransferase
VTTNMARLTVGVATLDRPHGLARCLDALLGGTTVPDEIIVVDQGSGTGTDAVISERLQRHPNLRHLRQERRGLSAARNLMVEEARCPIVAVTDDDCVPAPTWVSAVLSAFARSPEPDAVTGRVLALSDPEPNTYAISLRTDPNPADYTAVQIPWNVGTGANFAARRDAVIACGGYDERLGAGSAGRAAEDIDLSLRMLRAGARIRYEPAAVVHHECVSEARRMSTRWSYGYGIGAVVSLLAKKRDRFSATMLAAFLRQIARRLLRAVRRRDLSGVRQAALSLGGLTQGAVYGWRAAARSRR